MELNLEKYRLLKVLGKDFFPMKKKFLKRSTIK